MFAPVRAAHTLGVIAIAFLFLTTDLTARKPGYDLQVTSEPYAALTDAQRLPLTFDVTAFEVTGLEGETFHLFDVDFTFGAGAGIEVWGHGGIRLFDSLTRITIYPMLSFYDVTDPNAVISYRIDGEPGSRILKVEWRDGKLLDVDSGAYISFQLWIHQHSGDVELRYGPSSLPEDYVFPGFAYMDRYTEPFVKFDDNYMISGDPALPTFSWDSGTSDDLEALIRYPAEGTVYRFRPNTILTSVPLAVNEIALTLAPNPAHDYLTIDLGDRGDENATALLIDVAGNVVRSMLVNSRQTQLDLSELPSGIYFVEMHGEGWMARRKVVIR